jgi:hypothetical protein
VPLFNLEKIREEAPPELSSSSLYFQLDAGGPGIQVLPVYMPYCSSLAELHFPASKAAIVTFFFFKACFLMEY